MSDTTSLTYTDRDREKLLEIRKKTQEIMDGEFTAEDREKLDDLREASSEIIEAAKARSEAEKLRAQLSNLQTDKPEGTTSGTRDITSKPTEAEQRQFARNWAKAVLGAANHPRGDKRAAELKTGSKGGFLVPQIMADTVLMADIGQGSIAARALRWPTDPQQPDADIVIPALDQTGTKGAYAGWTISRVGEGSTITTQDKKFLRQVKLVAYDYAAKTQQTRKSLRNAEDLQFLIEETLSKAWESVRDGLFTTGTGSGEPLGFVKADAAKLTNRNTANDIKYVDLANMVGDLLMTVDGTVVASPSVKPTLMQMVPSGTQQLIWQPSAREGAPDTLLGYPIVWNPRSPTLGSKGDIAICDLGSYIWRQGLGLEIITDIDMDTLNAVLVAWTTLDGRPWLKEPILLPDGETELSAFSVLDVPSS